MGMLELVVIILGIIVAGGFLLYFFGDLVMGLAGKGKRDGRIISKKQLEQTKKLEERINALEKAEELKKNPAIATVLLNGGMIEDYNPDEEDDSEEEIEAPVQEENLDEEVEEIEQVEETEETEEIEETEEESAEEDDISDYIAKRRQELMEKLARIKEEESEESEDIDLNEDEEFESEEESLEIEETEESVEEIEEEVAEETIEEAEEVKPVEEVQPTVVVKTILGDLTELEEKLANAQERLKVNEKELRKCKKEYIPLRKVKKTLEKDENKLRRKEALVAKQKVMLYGVNNYADIDEEKAKKLAEDLDLLDGLKLSVQHCHEVMDNNKERYPLLEQIYTLLVTKNNDIKEEIKSLQDAIEQIKNAQ